MFVGLEVTRRCNMACPHCLATAGAKGHPGPDPGQVARLCDQLVALGVRHLALSGGEPLVRRDLEELMHEGRARGIADYSLVTNGFAVNAGRVDSLKAAGLVSVQVSVDGADAGDHCAVRGCDPKRYYRALRAVRLFREAGVAVDVATVLVGPNVERAREMVQLCHALGARSLRYCSFVPAGRAAAAAVRARHAADPDRLDACLAWLRQAPGRVIVDHGIGPWHDDGRLECVAGRDVAYVTAEGDLYPCTALMHEPFKVGNVFEADLAELVASPAMHRVRELCRADLGEPCRSCDNGRCSGGCRGAAYAATGDLYAAPAYCNYARRSFSSRPSRP